jgi:DHA2 family multidrug resistance protein
VFLAAHTTRGQPAFPFAAQGLAIRLSASGVNAALATRQSYARLYRALIGQATTLAYIDTYWILAVGAAIMFILSFTLKRNQPGAGGEIAL